MLPQGLSGKETACSAGDACLILGLGQPPGGGNGNPPQYSCLENLASCRPWGPEELDATEHVHTCAKTLELVGLFGSSLFHEVAEQFLAFPSSLWDRESC